MPVSENIKKAIVNHDVLDLLVDEHKAGKIDAEQLAYAASSASWHAAHVDRNLMAVARGSSDGRPELIENTALDLAGELQDLGISPQTATGVAQSFSDTFKIATGIRK